MSSRNRVKEPEVWQQLTTKQNRQAMPRPIRPRDCSACTALNHPVSVQTQTAVTMNKSVTKHTIHWYSVSQNATTMSQLSADNDTAYIYIGSSSVVVLIGSHSLCNSFVVNQFLFFHTKWIKFPLLYTQEAMRAIWWGKKMFCLFFICKIYPHVTQKWRLKTGMAIPHYLCWKLLQTRRKYSDISNLFAKLQHAKAPES